MLKRLANFPVIDCMIILIGAMILNTLYTQAALGHLGVQGFADLISQSAQADNAPLWWKEVLFWMGRNSAFFAPMTGPIMVATAVSMIMLFVRPIAALVASVIFLIFWVSLWAHPGIWIFELLFPLLFSVIATLATFPQFIDEPKARNRIFGPKVFGKMSLAWRLVLIVITSALLWYIVFLSKNAGAASTIVAWQSALTFAALFAASVFVDPMRTKRPKYEFGFRAIPWVDVIILCVAAMMVIQVFADQSVGFYTIKGYAKLVYSYAKTSNAPEWFRFFLYWSGDTAAFWMPVQAVFESSVAILLSVLIFRAPVLVLTTGLLLILNYAEFGVDASLKASSMVTGTWELSFVTITCIFVCIMKMARFIQARSWKERILGERFFGNLDFRWCLLIALLGGAALFFAGLKTHVFGKEYDTTSWLGGVSFAVLLAINVFIDKSFRIDSERK